LRKPGRVIFVLGTSESINMSLKKVKVQTDTINTYQVA
jgi:hypothetical protein